MNRELSDLKLSAREGYDRWSEFYDQDDIPLHLLEEKVVTDELGSVDELTIVDLACGTGRQTVRLAERGAHILGIDQSDGMLDKARTKKSAGNVDFKWGDINQPLEFADASFDRVVSFLALEHIEKLSVFFGECRRICKDEGMLYFTAMHPAMVLKGVQARYTEQNGRKVYPKSWPYMISDYLNASTEAGLTLVKMGEYCTDEKDAEGSARANKYKGWPLLLTLKFTP